MLRIRLIYLSVFLFGAASAAFGQGTADLRTIGREIDALKAGQAEILKELQELKGLLKEQPTPAVPTVTVQPGNRGNAAPAQTAPAVPEIVDMKLDIAGQPMMGDQNAKVTVVEFTDYQCPFCSRHFRQVWPRLDQDFVKTGKARFVLRDLPIDAIHPQAFKAAEAAYCARSQGKFWEMHDLLFVNQSALGRKELTRYAELLKLDIAAFDKCVDSEAGAAKIRKDIADSRQAEARGTPIFYVGLTEPGSNSLRAVRIIRGAHSYATFKDTIDELLSSIR